MESETRMPSYWCSSLRNVLKSCLQPARVKDNKGRILHIPVRVDSDANAGANIGGPGISLPDKNTAHVPTETVSSPPRNYGISIYESEVDFMIANALTWVGIETGGELYGLWTHGGRCVILLVTPPGPGAVHESAHFSQDLDYFLRANRELTERRGIQYLGDWHSHHFLNLQGPSGGDQAHIRTVAAKNHLSRMVQIVLTYDGERPGKRSYTAHQEHADIERVRVRAFFYADAPHGDYVECSIRVLPSVSPFRQSLAGSDIVSPVRFPKDRVSLNTSALSPESPTDVDPESAITFYLKEQLSQLPLWVREQARVFRRKGMMVLSLPLESGGVAAFAFDTNPPYPVRSVYLLMKDRPPVEATREVFADTVDRSLSNLHQRTLAIASSGGNLHSVGDTCSLEQGYDGSKKHVPST